MKTRVEKLKSAYEPLLATVAGDYLYKALLGFAEVLDNSENVHEIDPDLVDIYLMLSFKNGTTMQLTGQITDIYIEKEGTPNTVRLNLEDRKTGVMPNTTFIFSLSEIYTIQSLDVVTHQRKLAERYAAEDREGLMPQECEVKVECQPCYADGKTPNADDCAKCNPATPSKKEAKDGEEV